MREDAGLADLLSRRAPGESGTMDITQRDKCEDLDRGNHQGVCRRERKRVLPDEEHAMERSKMRG